MATAKERIQSKDYKELSALVMGTKEQLKRWEEQELKRQKEKVGRVVSVSSFRKYESTLNTLIQQIAAGQRFYKEAVDKWDKTPLSWAKFPDTHKEYRQMIYALETQKAIVSAEEKRMAREKAEAERPAPRPAPRASAPKKANWWKRAILGTALVAGGWFGAKQMNSNNGPEAGDKPSQSMQQRVTVTHQAHGYTLSATQTGSDGSLLPRLQQSVNQSMADVSAPMNDAAFNANVQGRWQRNVISGLDVQGSANQAAIARNMANTAAAKRAINYEEQRMKVDTMESWEDVSRSVERTTGNLRGTIEQATGGVNAFRDFGRALRGRK